MTAIHYAIVCRSGVLVQGAYPDFLGAIFLARRAKAQCCADLPNSLFRVQLRYPNNGRVPSEDVKAALRALAAPKVFESVKSRIDARTDRLHARSEARTDSRAVSHFSVLPARFSGCAFKQAGVVAPPEGSDLGTLRVFESSLISA